MFTRIRSREQVLEQLSKERNEIPFQRLTDAEVLALATCEYNEQSQAVVDQLIARESEVIRSRWSATERQNRSGYDSGRGWYPPQASVSVGLFFGQDWQDYDGSEW